MSIDNNTYSDAAGASTERNSESDSEDQNLSGRSYRTKNNSNPESPDPGHEPDSSHDLSGYGPDTGARVQCQTCGNTVSRSYAQVFGDNDNELAGCPECEAKRRRARGACAGVEVSTVGARDISEAGVVGRGRRDGGDE